MKLGTLYSLQDGELVDVGTAMEEKMTDKLAQFIQARKAFQIQLENKRKSRANQIFERWPELEYDLMIFLQNINPHLLHGNGSCLVPPEFLEKLSPYLWSTVEEVLKMAGFEVYRPDGSCTIIKIKEGA